MTGNLIATTPKQSMHALAFQGIMVYASFPQIRDMLMRNFGDDYVLLFARPQENTGDGTIDWYTPVQGEARPLLDLPEEEQAEIMSRIAAMAQEILKLAEQLINTHDPLKVTRGNILKLALCYPDNSCLYVVGGQPVYTCWGFGPGTPGVEGQNLSRLALNRTVRQPQRAESAQPILTGAPPVVAPAGSRGWGCLWLPLLLLLLLIALLFAGFGPINAISGYTLYRLPALSFLAGDADDDALSDLKNEVDRLAGQAADLAERCEKKSEPAPTRESPASESPRRPRQDLVIPEKAEDTSFLAGGWLCDTGLSNSVTGEPVKVEFKFNKDGEGAAVTRERNDVCEGAAKAELLPGGVLKIELAEQRCKKTGRTYSPVTIECKSAANRETECEGINMDGSRWSAIFEKDK